MKPTVGRIVHFRMGDADCRSVERQRTIAPGHVGPGAPPAPGDVLPAVITRGWFWPPRAEG